MASNNDVVRVGFIGAGAICRTRHLPGLANAKDVDVVAVCNRSRESSQRLADDFKIDSVEEDWRRLVARDDLDAVFIGTWPVMHTELSLAILEAGKHCFCQARMTTDLVAAKQMIAAANAHPELVNMICPCPFPLEHYVREMNHNGKLGQITSVELNSTSGWNLDKSTVTARERRELSGNQTLMVGIFAEALNAMVGPYESLSASFATPIATKTDDTGKQVQIEVPQVVTIQGKLESGALASEHHSGIAVDKDSVGNQLTIRGLEGTLRYDFDKKLRFAKPGRSFEKIDVPKKKRTAWTVEQDFINAVRAARAGKPRQERPVRPDFNEGLMYMRKIEAVHQSVATGQVVKPSQL